MGWFSRRSDHELRLIEEYANSYEMTGTPRQEALSRATDLVDKAKKAVKERGLENTPKDFGDILLWEEKVNPKITAGLMSLRADGVRDEDIRRWCNLPPIEQILIEFTDGLNRVSGFIALRRKGVEAEEAAKRIDQIHPRFGDNDTGTGDDRPLPYELKFRILAYMEKGMLNPTAWREKLTKNTTFNALVRQEMRNGNL